MKIVLEKPFFVLAKLRFLVVLSAIFIILFTSALCVLAQFKPVFEEKAVHAAKAKALEVINSAVDCVFSDINSQDMVKISTDESGKITSVSADTIAMNKLKSHISKTIHNLCEDAETSKISIPIGSLTSFSVLQGIGYRIPVKISTDGYAKIDFDDEFINAGINQVKHKIFMTISVKMSVISAAMSKSEVVQTEIPVAETVISGAVPNYFGENLSVVGR